MYLAINTIVQQIMIFHSLSILWSAAAAIKESVRKKSYHRYKKSDLGHLESLHLAVIECLHCLINCPVNTGNLNSADSSLLFAMQSRYVVERNDHIEYSN